MIHHSEFITFHTDYRKGEYPEMRFGQAFLGKYFPEVSDPELFYEESRARACALILSRNYVTYVRKS